MEFGEFLKKLREERNLSQGDIAKAIGVSRQSVSKWELGINEPKIDKLLSLSSFLHINISDLLSAFIEQNGHN